MTDYSDIPQANSLYNEIEKCNLAIQMIDSGKGTLTAFTVGPIQTAPPPPGTAGVPGVNYSPVQIQLSEPASAETMTQIRAQLVSYQQSCVDKLTEMGYGTTPARAA